MTKRAVLWEGLAMALRRERACSAPCASYFAWTCVAVHRIVRGAFALAARRGLLTRSPADGLAPAEVPRQRNARRVEVLDAETVAT